MSEERERKENDFRLAFKDYSYGEFCLLERKGDQPFHVDAQLFRDDNKFSSF